MKANKSTLFTACSLIVLLSLGKAVAQREPVSWLVSIDSVKKDKGSLVFKAKIREGWHLYSQHMKEGGPMPTTFKYTGKEYNIIGETCEKGKKTVYHDDIYDMEVAWYVGEVTFVQRVQIVKPNSFLKGSIEFMVCSGDLCMPFKRDFSVPTGTP